MRFNSILFSVFLIHSILFQSSELLAGRTPYLPTQGQVNVLVVFAQFRDDAPSAVALPNFSDQLLDARVQGSLTHFYQTLSSDQLTIDGTILPTRYTADEPAAAYLAADMGKGQFSRFAAQIIRQVDAQIDLGDFDNDGPDGLPNSGDDDGYVDYLFILMPHIPTGFLKGHANGIAGLRMSTFRSATAQTLQGEPIKISGHNRYGAFVEEGSFAQTVGIMAHEFGPL